ncbi:hypothetical protein MHYP_G00307420 [Metynnis hypsauchen]
MLAVWSGVIYTLSAETVYRFPLLILKVKVLGSRDTVLFSYSKTFVKKLLMKGVQHSSHSERMGTVGILLIQ